MTKLDEIKEIIKKSKIDLVFSGNLRPEIRDTILDEIVYI